MRYNDSATKLHFHYRESAIGLIQYTYSSGVTSIVGIAAFARRNEQRR